MWRCWTCCVLCRVMSLCVFLLYSVQVVGLGTWSFWLHDIPQSLLIATNYSVRASRGLRSVEAWRSVGSEVDPGVGQGCDVSRILKHQVDNSKSIIIRTLIFTLLGGTTAASCVLHRLPGFPSGRVASTLMKDLVTGKLSLRSACIVYWENMSYCLCLMVVVLFK